MKKKLFDTILKYDICKTDTQRKIICSELEASLNEDMIILYHQFVYVLNSFPTVSEYFKKNRKKSIHQMHYIMKLALIKNRITC